MSLRSKILLAVALALVAGSATLSFLASRSVLVIDSDLAAVIRRHLGRKVTLAPAEYETCQWWVSERRKRIIHLGWEYTVGFYEDQPDDGVVEILSFWVFSSEPARKATLVARPVGIGAKIRFRRGAHPSPGWDGMEWSVDIDTKEIVSLLK